MKTHSTKWVFLLALLSTGIFSNAQRGSHYNNDRSQNSNQGSHFDQRQDRFNQSPVARNSGPSYDRWNRSSGFGQRMPETGNNTSNVIATNRNRYGQPYGSGNMNQHPPSGFNQQRVITNDRVINNDRIINNRTVINNSRYNQYPGRSYAPARYGYAPRRYEYAGAPRYSMLPHGSLSLRFHNYPYYYNSGLFYSYYNGFYEPVFAPIGIHIRVLPVGYYPIYIGARRYYYYEGTYYWENGMNDYEVVDAPIGAVLSALPRNATLVTVNGEPFYEFNGTYYKQGVNNRNEVVYTVVGKYGNINNTNLAGVNALPQSLHVGDVVESLPDGSKSVTIDGETLYVSPDNTYFRAQSDANGAITYEVVGTQPNQ